MIPIKECPKCGCKEYYTKERAKGFVYYRHSMEEGENAENGEMYETLSFEYASKFARCVGCDAKLFDITKYDI